MVDMSNFIDFTLIKLKQIDIGKGVCLLTYKKDRKVTVFKEEDCYKICEDGFYKEIFLNLTEKDVRKILKSMIKKEFPRSNRLHLIII